MSMHSNLTMHINNNDFLEGRGGLFIVALCYNNVLEKHFHKGLYYVFCKKNVITSEQVSPVNKCLLKTVNKCPLITESRHILQYISEWTTSGREFLSTVISTGSVHLVPGNFRFKNWWRTTFKAKDPLVLGRSVTLDGPRCLKYICSKCAISCICMRWGLYFAFRSLRTCTE